MKKIAVLHAQIPFSRGGAELMVETLTKELCKRGFQAELISIPFRWYPENGLYDNMLMWKMLDLSEVNGESIDLVIPTKFPTYGINHPNKVLWLMHQHRAAYDLYLNKEHFGLGTIDNGEKMRGRIIKFDEVSLKESKRIYTISKNVAARLKENSNLQGEALYHPPALQGRYYSDNFDNYILTVGRLDPLKRNDLIIRALKFCDKNIQLVIVGKGPEKEKLEHLADREGVIDRVKFLGFVKDEELLKLYANTRGVYFAPVDEDYGYITLEAFLSGKPVITCKDSGGVLEFVEDGKSGFVCDVQPENIAECINKLFGDSSLAKAMGQEGCKSVKNISWDNVVDRLTAGI